MHNTWGDGFETILCVIFVPTVLPVLDIHLTYTGEHYFPAVSPVLEGPSYRLLAACPFWSNQYLSGHFTLSWVKQLFHYLLSANVGIILGLTSSKSLWYFFCFASLNLLFWLNCGNYKPLQATSRGHLVPINKDISWYSAHCIPYICWKVLLWNSV